MRCEGSGCTVQGSVAREVPESPGHARKQAKEAKKGRDAGLPSAAAKPPRASEYADQLKKVCCCIAKVAQ